MILYNLLKKAIAQVCNNIRYKAKLSAILFLKQAPECCIFCIKVQVVAYCIDELLLSKYLCSVSNDRLSERCTMSNEGHIVSLLNHGYH